MRQVIVSYRVKPDRVAENEALIRDVFDELARTEPEGLHYASFKLSDGVSFAHVAIAETREASAALQETAAFKEFQREIRDRCDQPPVVTDLEPVGAYRWVTGERSPAAA